MENINKGQSNGLWKYAVYVFAKDSASSKNIASLIKATTQGKESYISPALKRYCQMLWIEVWIGKGLSDFLQHTIFKFHVLGHKVKLFKAFQSSPTFFCLPTEFKSHGFCGLCRSVALC